ncbi:MAG: BLUF domain-containing protein [Oceanicaulis sp.]
MLLVRSVYYSKATPGSDGSLNAILKASRDNNRALNITGALVYDRGRFLQVLEGARPVVSGLLRRIAADPRHQAMTLAEFTEINARRYADWSMAYVDADAAAHPVRLTEYDAAPAEALLRQVDLFLERAGIAA